MNYLSSNVVVVLAKDKNFNEAEPQAQAEWKKNLAQQVQQIQTDHPDCDVEVWAMDEGSVINS